MIAAVVLHSGADPTGSAVRETCEAALASAAGVVVAVLGPRAVEVARSLEGLSLEVVLDDRWRDGPGSAVRCAMRHLLKARLPEAVLFTSADGNAASEAHVDGLIAERERSRKSLVGTARGERISAPAIFGREFFPALLCVPADDGLRRLLDVNRANAGCVSPLAGGVVAGESGTDEAPVPPG
jgi:CTP:molybdopterin cytidylyltransferase MocA